jgi:hypothetical protein
MPEAISISQFERRLVEMGCPSRSLKERVRELAEHYEDLKQAALEEGLSEREAEEQAGARLGDPITLAENAVMLSRQSSWWGRHPIIGFCLLPYPAFILGWSVCWVSLYWLLRILGLVFGPSYALDDQTINTLGDNPKVFSFFANPLNIAVSLITTLIVVALLCKAARRAALGLNWMLITCASCALINFFSYSEIVPRALLYGLSWYPLHWFYAGAPLLIALALFIRQRQLENRLAAIPMGPRPRNAQKPLPPARPQFYRIPTYWVMAALTLAILVSTFYGIRAASAEKLRKAELKSKIWPAERAATLALLKTRQAIVPPSDQETISLKPWLNATLTDSIDGPGHLKSNNLAALPGGIQTFGGVAFDIEGAIQLASTPLPGAKRKYPARVQIPVSSKCSKIDLLPGAGNMTTPGMKVAYLILNYADGSKAQLDIIGAKDVLDWWGPIYNTDSGIGRYTTSPDTELAWAGSNPAIEKNAPQFSLRLYRTTFVNPHPDREIASVDFVSALRGAAPFLVGLTIETP